MKIWPKKNVTSTALGRNWDNEQKNCLRNWEKGKRGEIKFREIMLPWLWVTALIDHTPHFPRKNKIEGKDLRNHVVQLYHMKPEEVKVQRDKGTCLR